MFESLRIVTASARSRPKFREDLERVYSVATVGHSVQVSSSFPFFVPRGISARCQPFSRCVFAVKVDAVKCVFTEPPPPHPTPRPHKTTTRLLESIEKVQAGTVRAPWSADVAQPSGQRRVDLDGRALVGRRRRQFRRRLLLVQRRPRRGRSRRCRRRRSRRSRRRRRHLIPFTSKRFSLQHLLGTSSFNQLHSVS